MEPEELTILIEPTNGEVTFTDLTKDMKGIADVLQGREEENGNGPTNTP